MIKEACENYFHLIRHPFEAERKRSDKILTVVAYLSCITLIVPPIVGLVYGVSSLAGRIKKKLQQSETDLKVSQKSSAASVNNGSRIAGGSENLSSVTQSQSDENPQSESTSEASESNIEAKRAIQNELSPEMVEALGGVDYALQIPIIEGWDGVIGRVDVRGLQAPVMRGNFSDGRPFLLFCYFKRDPAGYRTYVDCLVREKHGWESPKVESSELGKSVLKEGIFRDDSQYSEREKYMLERIKRLMRGESVGLLNALPNIRAVLPGDAILQKEELQQLVALNMANYEQRPMEGVTGLFLCDPAHVEDSLKQLHAKFRGTEKITTYVEELKLFAEEGDIEEWKKIFLSEVAVVSSRVDKPLLFDTRDVKKFSDLVADFRDRGLTLKLWFDKEMNSEMNVRSEIARRDETSSKNCVWGIIELFLDTKNAELKPNKTISGIPVVSAGVLADDQGNWFFQKGENPDDFFEENRYVTMFVDLKRADVAIQKNSFEILRTQI